MLIKNQQMFPTIVYKYTYDLSDINSRNTIAVFGLTIQKVLWKILVSRKTNTFPTTLSLHVIFSTYGPSERSWKEAPSFALFLIFPSIFP